MVRACPSRLVVSGGPKPPSTRAVFQMTFDAITAGAKGVTFGRNIWQADDPGAIVNALNLIIHENGTVEEALEFIKGK